jgi:hypothetical protein
MTPMLKNQLIYLHSILLNGLTAQLNPVEIVMLGLDLPVLIEFYMCVCLAEE